MTMNKIYVIAGSILLMLGILVINNVFAKYWKPVTLTNYNYHPMYYEPTHTEQNATETKINKEPTLHT